MRRIISKLTIDEISAVDRPAQEDARMVIMKRESGGDEDMNTEKIDIQALAHIACELAAKELRKSHPELTVEQAYSKVYESNLDIRKADRAGSVLKFTKQYPPVARTTPAVAHGDSNDTDLADLQELAAELQRTNPYLTVEQAFARVYSDPANAELAKRERRISREQLYENL